MLLIEDHPHMRQLLSIFINSQPGLSLEAAFESAEAALEYIGDKEPTLVLTDISLPGMSGVDLIRELHERFGEVPCLVVTGQAHLIYMAAARRAGARGFIDKGSPETLQVALASVASGGEYWQELP